jgi:hypothetical protein
MSIPAQEPEQPLTAAQVDEWVRNATIKRLELHLRAAESFSSIRAQAFWEMVELCKDAIEAVRIVSAQLRHESQAASDQSAEILTDSARLLARYTASAESQLLQIFKGEKCNGETQL